MCFKSTEPSTPHGNQESHTYKHSKGSQYASRAAGFLCCLQSQPFSHHSIHRTIMSDENLIVHLANATSPTLIKVIGVGGGGGNAVAHMYRENIEGVRFLACNTDQKALEDSPIPDRLQLGPGLGAGGKPEKARELAVQNIEEIKNALDKDTKMVFITAGMGGGTGTGASPIIAHEAMQKGILTIGIVTIPFLFEREKQINKALDGLDALSKEVDALLVINNQRLCDIYPNLSIVDAFKRADETLTTAVRSITEIITMHGHINLDFEDVRTVLTKGGVAIMSTGYAEGEQRVTKAIEQALHSPLLNNNDFHKSDRILLSITFNDAPESALRTEEMNEITEFMSQFDADIETKWGMATDPSLGDQVKITILASGFGLYGAKSKRKEEEAKAIKENPEAAERLWELQKIYYGSPASDEQLHLRKKKQCFIFSTNDLLHDDALLAAVESKPTCKRTRTDLDYLRNLSEAESTMNESPRLSSSKAPTSKFQSGARQAGNEAAVQSPYAEKPVTISFDLTDNA